ncbi:MAG: hypothetical protein J7M34_11335 [Anaerolineae bacterium]|nr:hypothetical protein [Anaerolineae bacterium]
MALNQEESLAIIRQLLKARDDQELHRLVSMYLPVIDGTFFTVLNQAVTELEREGKPDIARALEALGAQMLKMKTLI